MPVSHVTVLADYQDERGNTIEYQGTKQVKADITFVGSNNRLVVAADANVVDLKVIFKADHGHAQIDSTTKTRSPMNFEIRVGHRSTVHVAENVGCAGRAFLSAVEGTHVTIGADVMFAKSIEVRADDTHPIYDVRTGKRKNTSRSIDVGPHVWIAKHAVIMGGVTIGSGSVIGFRSIVTKSVPNNCVAVGAPAHVVQRNIAWERPEVVARRAEEIYPRKGEKSDSYWAMTADDQAPVIRRPDLSAARRAPTAVVGLLSRSRILKHPAVRPRLRPVEQFVRRRLL